MPERVRNGERRPVWSPHEGTDEDTNVRGTAGGGEQKTQTLRLQDGPKWESSEEEEKGKGAPAPVIKARVVRSVSLGREEDDNGVEGVSVKQETEDGDPDSEARLLSSRTPAKSEPVEVEPTSAVSAEAPPPIPDTPAAVYEPPIAVSRTVVDLRA